eukprot:962800-Ditylum_brightwellii.AAC.1
MAFAAFAGYSGAAIALISTSTSITSSMWQILDSQQSVQAFKTIFGGSSDRGEYMDGYSRQSMAE